MGHNGPTNLRDAFSRGINNNGIFGTDQGTGITMGIVIIRAAKTAFTSSKDLSIPYACQSPSFRRIATLCNAGI